MPLATDPISIALALITASCILLLLRLRQAQSALATDKHDRQADLKAGVKEITDAVCEGLIDIDLISGCYEISSGWCQSTGYSAQKLPSQIAETLSQIIHPGDVSRLQEVLYQPGAGKSETKIVVDFRLRHADGNWLWMHGVGKLYFDPAGRPLRVIASHNDITSVKKDQQKLRNSQSLAGFREYQYNSKTRVISVSPLTHLKDPAEQSSNWTHSTLEQMTHPDDVDLLRQTLELAVEKSRPLTLEFRVINPDGQIRNLVAYGEQNDDNPIISSGVFRDITRQKKTESRYVEFGKLLDGSLTGLIIARVADMAVLYANQKYCRDSGYHIDEVIGRPCFELILNGHEAEIRDRVSNLKNKQREQVSWDQITTQFHRKDGSHYPADIWVQLSEWEGETVVAAMILDISDKVAAQQALQRSEQKYRRIFDALPDGVCLFKQDDLTIVDCNHELVTSHGWTLDEVKGRPVSIFTAKRELHKHGEGVQQLQNGSEKVTVEVMEIRKDKTEFPIEAHVKAITIGTERFVVVVARDMTERHRYVKQLKQQKADIEQFTFSISHDLKTPLVTLEGFSEILAENLANNDIENAEQDLRRINAAAIKMHDLLSELLEFSLLRIKPNTNKVMAMNLVINEALALLAGEIAAATATIRVAPNLPSVTGDRARLAQLYRNLIENSIKFCRTGVPINIELGWDDQKQCFFVDDNGRGIASQFQHRIFVLFDQLDPATPGSGIGLAEVKRIIENHGGQTWVESPSLLGGTKICFSISEQK